MIKAIAIGAVGLALSASMLGLGFISAKSGPATVGVAADRSVEGMSRDGIEAIVRSYLLENPEIILEVQAALETREREDRRLAQADTIAEVADELFHARYDGVIGNPDGDVTIVEFFDYNCGFCRRAMDDMDEVVAADPDVRFVLKEFPILGPDSQEAHIVSMAFQTLYPEVYGDFHRDLMVVAGRANEHSAIRIALEHGADEEALRREMENPEIEEAFARTYALANRLAVTGTPSYVIGQEVVFGAQGAEVLFEKVEITRANSD